MVVRKCSHERKATGILHCDLSRDDASPSRYTTTFNVSICEECGLTELYCESARSACEWLASGTRSARYSKKLNAV